MWLPTFIGLNNSFKKRIEDELAPLLQGKELTEDLLDAASDRVIDILCESHKSLPGLRDYLDAIKFVEDTPRPA